MVNELRRAGILLPVFSLPSPYGIGTMGKAAFDFVDFLADSGQSLWQILPMGPADPAGSPYKSLSAFAGNPLYIDLDLLVADGLLTKREIKPLRDATAGERRVNYAIQQEQRLPVLFKAAARLEEDAGYKKFIKENAWWLNDFALFISDESAAAGSCLLPPSRKIRTSDVVAEAGDHFLPSSRKRLTPDAAEAAKRIQYLFYTQWRRLKRYANARGIGVVGDLPFYIGAESADYRAHPELFVTDEEGRPGFIAGVPPDAFAEDGQVWNEPVYNWKEHKRTGYDWWLRRFRNAAEMYDLCRVDHFRAFAQYYAIPAGKPAKDGAWMDGPGRAFIDAVRKAAPSFGIIAEDLGIITEDVHALREYSGYPGMRVLQFAFEPGEDSTYLPHNHIKDCVVYTGTHDNATLREWAAKAGKSESEFARAYLGVNSKNLPVQVLKAALGSVAGAVIIPLQDYMGLGAESRINTPGIVSRKNWTWRLSGGDFTKTLSRDIRALSGMYGRS
ncbi:MAG: 4-alpha-glucanotransferase [Clostridiales Family XIII bacterium]|jgi:4-alpha-glucanotransferase|nr:4-alpha-glucanotransferase [Clostridiales Family XIII bacterium]